MIGTWVMVAIAALAGTGFTIYFMAFADSKVVKIGGAIVSIIVAVVICAGCLWWLYGTESGKRPIKDYQSNISGGIERVVTVYDINGNIIKEYSGQFDVEYNEVRIKFVDENNKTHIVYYTTGTITIDEVE